MKDIAIIVPALDPDKNLNIVVNSMSAAGFSNIILVDDGSSESKKEVFRQAVEQNPGSVLLVHKENKGKGCALKTAFSYILENLPEVVFAITIDSDGQHTPEDSIRLAKKALENTNEFVFGCRDFNDKSVPLHRRLANKITAGVFKAFFGLNISDAQTGLRAYPTCYIKDLLNVEGERYEYESNVLIWMCENNIPYSEISIKTIYSEENTGSHFNLIKDSYRIYKPILSKATSFKYILSSGAGTIADATFFTILNSIFGKVSNIFFQTFLTTGIARVLSAVLNYTLNYKWVFKSDASQMKSAAKYAATAVVQYGLSYLLCSLVFSFAFRFGIVGFGRTLLKLLVDLLLFFISYKVQKIWVFKK